MFIIHDNFYNNPEGVRAWALQQEFSVRGNFPGWRTPAYPEPYNTNVKEEIERIINKKITFWPGGYNTAFQYTTENCRTWVHYDPTDWAAVCYLTPDAPTNTGTGIFRHREEGLYKHEEGQTDYNAVQQTQDDWELLDYCGNVFNRIVIYEGSFYHSSVIAGFGQDQHNGRLFQTFFFNAE
jgi:hypothetical protein